MNSIIRKFIILKDSLIGYFKKGLIDINRPTRSCQTAEKTIPIVVSLTSYGRRVSSVVYYTLVSILNQTVRPHRIILWLDDSWSEDNLPAKLLSLKRFGVEYKFCKDIKSYKKLIPTLQEIEDYPIVTVDDDVMYVPNFLETLYDSYLSDPKRIHCTHALTPILTNDQQFYPYVNWPDYDYNNPPQLILPIGEGGILYPPQSLHKDVTNMHLAKELCPNADDIWFWIMALRQGTSHKVVTLKKSFYSFDALYQYFHKGSALTHSNAKENKNDIQLRQVVSYFNLKF